MKKLYFLLSLLMVGTIIFAQPTQVLDINPSGNSSPNNLFVFDGNIYFGADDSSGTNTGGTDLGRELWISDGTSGGTLLVKDIRVGSSNSAPFAFFILDGSLYFSANDGGGSRIWTTDGTDPGTVNTNNGFSNLQPIVVGSKAYMTATTLSNTFYEFDGTMFQQVPDTGAGTASPIGGVYAALDNNTILVYMEYSTDEATTGRELYSYSISTQAYTLVKDINSGTGDASISNMHELNGTMYFEALSNLWQSDGTDMGTAAVSSAVGIGSVNNVYAWNNLIFFEGDNGTDGDQLYVYNPTAGTTTNISNISGTNSNHDPSDYAEFDGYLYYRGEDANDSSGHLFRTDGSTIEQLDDTIIDVDDIVVLGGKLYFEADNGSNGNELFTFDPATLSIESVALVSSVSVYPNPTSGVLNVVQNSFDDQLDYDLIDLTGKVVKSGQLENSRIDFNAPSGLYLLKLRSKSSVVTKKIVVQ